MRRVKPEWRRAAFVAYLVFLVTLGSGYFVNLGSERAPQYLKDHWWAGLIIISVLIALPLAWQARENTRNDRRSAAVRRQMVRKIEAETRALLDRMMANVPRIQLYAHIRPGGMQSTSEGRCEDLSEVRPIVPQRVDQLFDDIGRAMLLSGKGGSGKRVFLADLCAGLCRRFRDELSPDVPVLVSLSGKNPRTPFEVWLRDAIVAAYPGISPRAARECIDDRALILLVDGLDDITEFDNRVRVLRELEDFLKKGLCAIAVSCRSDAVRGLTIPSAIGYRVEVKSPDVETAKQYLASLKSPAADAVAAVPPTDTAWWSLIGTPLLLGIIAQISALAPDAKLVSEGNAKSRRRYILSRYVDVVVGRHKGGHVEYSPQDARRWLSWLAAWMKRHGQSEFYVDRIPASWIADVTDVVSLRERPSIWAPTIYAVLLSAVVAGMFGGDWEALMTATAYGLPMLLLTKRHIGRFHRDASQPIRLVWRMYGRWLVPFVSALPFIFVAVYVVNDALGLGQSTMDLLLVTLTGGTILAPIALVEVLAPQGMSNDVGLPSGARIRRNQRNAWLTAFGVCLPLVVLIAITRSLRVGDLALGFWGTLPLVVILPYCGWLVGGGVAMMQYRALFKVLAQTGRGPADYVRFLAWAQDRLILQTNGSGVRFPHREVRDFLAQSWRDGRQSGQSK
ncbi:NACHT domain-containing protein [Actinokineospora soli]|uniref:NACHT domain-containing protein n=1 Tax=Actinokineospora soli TaxID=1048753 RepID=A0ABW2TZ53_9PSEU